MDTTEMKGQQNRVRGKMRRDEKGRGKEIGWKRQKEDT